MQKYHQLFYRILVAGICSLTLMLDMSCGKKDVKADEPVTQAPAATPEPTPPPVDEQNDLKIVYFDTNKANLTSETKAALRENVRWLKKNPQAKVQIEGNCDERGTEEYNQTLGKKRASKVRHFLVTHGIKSKRLHVVSYGKDKPADPGHDESAWAKNRRVAFRLNAQ